MHHGHDVLVDVASIHEQRGAVVRHEASPPEENGGGMFAPRPRRVASDRYLAGRVCLRPMQYLVTLPQPRYEERVRFEQFLKLRL